MRLTISQRLLQRGKSSRGERKHKKWKIKNDVKAKEVTSTWGVREPQRRKPPAGGAEFSLQPTFSSRLISFSLAHHLRPILHWVDTWIWIPDSFKCHLTDQLSNYTFGRCTLRLRTFRDSSGVNLYTPASCKAARDGGTSSPSQMALSEDLSKSLNSTAEPGRRFNKIQASLTLRKKKKNLHTCSELFTPKSDKWVS